MKLLLNILWFVLGGWISMLAWALAGVVLAVTIVGLPWTAAAFRIAGFSAAPFGRHMVPRQAAGETGGSQAVDGLLNIIWFVLAGWWLALQHLVLAFLLACTVIGIPFAMQHLKLAMLSLAPVGARVVAL
jgi:uncharacterized membrane protein YccF (DUF307 family)